MLWSGWTALRAAALGLLALWFAQLALGAVIAAVVRAGTGNHWSVLLLIPAFGALAISGEATAALAALLTRRRGT